MQRVERHIIIGNKNLDKICFLSKNLYNYANYLIRQEFTQNNKLLSEYELTTKLAKEKQADYIALPSQTSQQVIKILFKNWKSFFKLCKKKDKLKGRPKMPKYKHKEKKKSDYLDIILQSKKTVTISQIAQDYGFSAKAFNKILKELHIQHKINGQWILYASYLGEGYVHSKTVSITRSDGTPDTVMNTEWTQKGRIFLYNTLKGNGYLPLIEQ